MLYSVDFKIAAGSKSGLYPNAQSASYLSLTLTAILKGEK